MKSLALSATCVSSDNSFLSVRQEPTLRPCKGYPFLQQKDTVKRMKRETTTWEKVFANHILDKSLYVEYSKNIQNSENDNQPNF